jgi:hypothetical protein
MDWLAKFFGTNSQNGALGTIGGLVGGLGQAWAGVENARYNKKIMKMNMDLFNRQKARQDANDKAFNQGFRLDLYGR